MEQLYLPAGSLELLKRVLAAEVLADKDLEAVLDLGLLRSRDIAADPWSTDQDHEGHFKHLFVVKEETHVRQSTWIAC